MAIILDEKVIRKLALVNALAESLHEATQDLVELVTMESERIDVDLFRDLEIDQTAQDTYEEIASCTAMVMERCQAHAIQVPLTTYP